MSCSNQFSPLADIVSLESLEEAKAPFASFERYRTRRLTKHGCVGTIA